MKFIHGLALAVCGTQLISTAIAKDIVRKDTTKLPQVVVTALRYPEKIYEVPLAISKIEKKEIQNSIGNGFDKVLDGIPGILAQTRSGTPDMKLTIRGFGARGAGDRSNSGTSRSIKVILDGIPETEPDGRTSFDNIDMAFADNIEVLRSNAASVYGNSAAGVVAISTFPSADKDFIQINALGGAWGMRKIAVTAFDKKEYGGIVGNFSGTTFDGYRQNSDGEKYTVNLGFKGAISDKTFLSTVLTGGYNLYHIPGPLTLDQFNSDPTAANATYLKREERRKNHTLRLGLNVEHLYDEHNSISATIFANPKYLQRSERNTFRDFTRYHIGGAVSYKNELKINDNFKNIAIAGIDEAYQDGAILFYNLTATSGRGTLKENKSEGANNLGGFIQDELIINDKWSVLLGLRWDEISYYSASYFVEGETELPPYEAKHYSHITPKAALSYRFTDKNMVYASVGGGIEVPAGNETSPNADYPNLQINPLLEPIISTTYELGTKNIIEYDELILSSLRYEAALYYIDVKNELVPYSEGKFYMSAGKTQRLGAEFGVGTELFSSLQFNASLTYMSSQYSEYLVDLGQTDTLKVGQILNYKDNKMAGVPDMYYNVSLRYVAKDFHGLFAEISAQGVGKYFADDANKFEVPSYNIINMSFGMEDYFKINSYTGIRLYVNLNNLTDQKYAASSFINPSMDKATKQAMYLESGLPRNLSLGMSLKFD